MSSAAAVLVVVATAAACSSNAQAPASVPPPPADAALDGITEIGSYDPTSGMHLDDDGSAGSAAARPTTPRRAGRPIEITLRSQPPQADVQVDGVPLGKTPAFWMGEANGKEHTFTFALRGHGTAMYRFVPVQSGVVHGRLLPVSPGDEPPADASVPPAPRPQPQSKITPPAPPPTVVTPKPDAAVPAPDAAMPTSDGSGSAGSGS